MRKIFFTFILLLSLSTSASASHITGGEMYYETLGNAGPLTTRYRITLILFRDENCFNCADMPGIVSIGIFNLDDNSQIGGYQQISVNRIEMMEAVNISHCITNPPNLRYGVGFYVFEINLANNARGYTAVYQTCCRISGIQNVADMEGATYSTTIPGSNTLPLNGLDNSPRFARSISVVCFEKYFELDFSAFDPDGDSLVYSMCSALDGGAASDASFATPAPPPYPRVTYIGGFTGTTPLGPQVNINSRTGIISGVAPNAGRYVISVCVDSYRNGRYIGTHYKDFILTIAPCDLADAQLDPDYFSCDGFTVNFTNQTVSPLNESFFWDFGVPGQLNDTSILETPTFTYPDTGIYRLTLIINKGLQCSDTAYANVHVFPGFFPEYTQNSPICRGAPVQFNDITRATYGNVDFWKWDFGVAGINNDTSRLKNPTWIYNTVGTYTASLIVASNKGCRDTIFQQVNIVEKPSFFINGDTLICSIDTVQLTTTFSNPGTVRWTPNYNISDVNSPNPLVSPDVTTTYIANYTDNSGCEGADTITIRVVDNVSMTLPRDTTICLTDAFEMPLRSDGIRFTWSPPAFLDDPNIKNPISTPEGNITYRVRGEIGGCFTERDITVRPVPYPDADAGADRKICFGNSTTLQASGGSIYQWSPVLFLNNPNIANPNVQTPGGSMQYIVSVRDTLGCPKPVRDTVLVEVARLVANAGPSDTSIVTGQPLQLNGTGGDIYLWTPATALSNPNIASPVATPTGSLIYTLTVRNDIGCTSTDTIRVNVFNVEPDLYVPSAFSPDGDGLNETFRPIPIGMRSITIFRVYNRWGQLIFTERGTNEGWNGRVKGVLQDAGSYVWYAEGITYQGRKISRKGSVILIK